MKTLKKKQQPTIADHHYIVSEVAQRCQISHYEYENGKFTLFKDLNNEQEKGYVLDRLLLNTIISETGGIPPAIDYISGIIAENLFVG